MFQVIVRRHNSHKSQTNRVVIIVTINNNSRDSSRVIVNRVTRQGQLEEEILGPH